MLKKLNKKILFENLHLFYISLAIVFASLYFIYLGWIGEHEIIGTYALLSTYTFLLIHLFGLGVDQYLMASTEESPQRCSIPSTALLPLLIISIIFIIIYSFFSATILNYLKIETKEKYVLVLIYLSIICGIYSKIFAAIFVVAKKISSANILYLGKAIGMGIGINTSIFIFSINDVWLVVFITEFFGFLLIAYRLAKNRNIFAISIANTYFDRRFIICGLNIFAFDAIMKADLILLSFFDRGKFFVFYSAVSAVFEGYLQLFSSYKYRLAGLVRLGLLAADVNTLVKSGLFLSLSFIFSSITFILFVFHHISLEQILVLVILQIALSSSAYGVITFHVYELLSQPFMLFIVSVSVLSVNLLTGFYFLHNGVEFGVAIGTLTAFTILSILNYLYILLFRRSDREQK